MVIPADHHRITSQYHVSIIPVTNYKCISVSVCTRHCTGIYRCMLDPKLIILVYRHLYQPAGTCWWMLC